MPSLSAARSPVNSAPADAGPMEAWRRVWRLGLAPQLSERTLELLARALVRDDPVLLQGATTSPPPLQCVQDWPVEAAEPVAFALWQGNGLTTVGEVEAAWAQATYLCDLATGDPASYRWFANWWDEMPRQIVRAQLMAEVNRTLARLAAPVREPVE